MSKRTKVKPAIKPTVYFIQHQEYPFWICGLESEGIPALYLGTFEGGNVPVILCDARTHKVVKRKKPVNASCYKGVSIARFRKKNRGVA